VCVTGLSSIPNHAAYRREIDATSGYLLCIPRRGNPAAAPAPRFWVRILAAGLQVPAAVRRAAQGGRSRGPEALPLHGVGEYGLRDPRRSDSRSVIGHRLSVAPHYPRRLPRTTPPEDGRLRLSKKGGIRPARDRIRSCASAALREVVRRASDYAALIDLSFAGQALASAARPLAAVHHRRRRLRSRHAARMASRSRARSARG